MIVVNARFLTQQTTGVQRFAIEICKELKKSNLYIEFVSSNNIINKEIAEILQVKKIGPLQGHLWEQITLQAYVRKKKGLLISLCNTAPLFLKNQIVTIHDLSFRLHPEWNSKLFSFYYNKVIPIISKNSVHILTVSNTSKKELIKELKILENKISVVYNAVSDVFVDLKDEEIDEDYILTVSSLHPRKNLKRLIDAFLKISDPKLKLYIIGNVNKHFTRENLIDDKIKSKINIFNDVNDKDLAKYYNNAKLFVYTSVYEGFGIPIIEAMNYKVPICISNIPIFKEVCGKEGVYFNPLDVEDIKDKINFSLQNKRKTYKIAKKYNWKTSGEKVLEIIKIYC